MREYSIVFLGLLVIVFTIAVVELLAQMLYFELKIFHDSCVRLL